MRVGKREESLEEKGSRLGHEALVKNGAVEKKKEDKDADGIKAEKASQPLYHPSKGRGGDRRKKAERTELREGINKRLAYRKLETGRGEGREGEGGGRRVSGRGQGNGRVRARGMGRSGGWGGRGRVKRGGGWRGGGEKGIVGGWVGSNGGVGSGGAGRGGGRWGLGEVGRGG